MGDILYLGNKHRSRHISETINPEEVGQYSWGSAYLATLYRSLCDGAIYGTSDMPGCTILLQAWAWSRMSCLAPVPRIPPQAHIQLPLANM